MTIENTQNYQTLKELRKELKYSAEILSSKSKHSPSEIIYHHMKIKELIKKINNEIRIN